ncbi:hypothetical protein CSA56_17590 [candidate division KSB3 bacterium]|uniref:Uncharacterized protein n=1 Tax=candidate division KSB3 bacterium TaxID=2044937 RepID=A0A2G6K7R6_9BACT|nr:MAG: hypothetical protein CSA56_17590 [candidate division KSB3 bacterium]
MDCKNIMTSADLLQNLSTREKKFLEGSVLSITLFIFLARTFFGKKKKYHFTFYFIFTKL